MKAKIVSWTDGSISKEIYEVVQKKTDNNVLIVGEEYDGKPITMTYKDSEVLFLENFDQDENQTIDKYEKCIEDLKKFCHDHKDVLNELNPNNDILNRVLKGGCYQCDSLTLNDMLFEVADSLHIFD